MLLLNKARQYPVYRKIWKTKTPHHKPFLNICLNLKRMPIELENDHHEETIHDNVSSSMKVREWYDEHLLHYWIRVLKHCMCTSRRTTAIWPEIRYAILRDHDHYREVPWLHKTAIADERDYWPPFNAYHIHRQGQKRFFMIYLYFS